MAFGSSVGSGVGKDGVMMVGIEGKITQLYSRRLCSVKLQQRVLRMLREKRDISDGEVLAGFGIVEEIAYSPMNPTGSSLSGSLIMTSME